MGILSVPWVGVPPRGQGSIAGKTHRITAELADDYEFTVVGGTTGRAPSLEHPAIRYVPVPDRLDKRYLDRLVGVGNRAIGRRRHLYHQVPYHPVYARRGAAEFARAGCTTVVVHEFPQWVPIVRRALPRSRIILWGGADSFIEVDALLGRVRGADSLVGASGSIARRFAERVPELAARTHVVYSGVDTDRFHPAPGSGTDPADVAGERIVFAGRLTPEKGLHVLVDAFCLLAEQHPQLELLLVGPPWVTHPDMLQGTHPRHLDEVRALTQRDYKAELLRRAGRHAARVSMPGPRTGHDLVRCLQDATVFCHPVLCEEGFGTVVAEAMACGAPVVISDRGGPPEYVDDGVTGLVVSSGDSVRLAEAIGLLLDDPARRREMGRAGARAARAKLSSVQSAQAFRSVLDGHAVPVGDVGSWSEPRDPGP